MTTPETSPPLIPLSASGEGEGGKTPYRTLKCAVSPTHVATASSRGVLVPRLLGLAAALLLVVTWSTHVVRAEGPPFEPGVVLVRWGPSAAVMAQEASLAALEARAVDSIPQLGIMKLQVPPGSEEAAAAALRRAGAEIAEPSYLRRIALTPNDPLYSQQWALSKIKAPSAWDLTTGSSSIIVAIIDTGFETSHPDRPQTLLLGADYIADISGKTPVSGDPQGHGTHVAGIVAARMNNGTGVAGVAPGVTLMPVRVLNEKGEGNTFVSSKGITYAADHGAKIINLSLSGTGSSPSEEQAVNYAYSKGALVVAAAGNCYATPNDCDNQLNPIQYPAAFDHVVAVAATDMNDSHAYYSETGYYVDLAAPGGGSSLDTILSTCINSTYCKKAGTSMAAPHVAGVAALVWSVNPNLTPDQVETILRQSAVDLGACGRDDTFGYGRVDAYQAVTQARSTLGYASLVVVGWSGTARAEALPFEPGVVLVRWGPSAAVMAQEAALAALGAQEVDRIPQLGIVKLRVPPGSEEAAAAALRLAGAEMAGLDYVLRAALVPNDPRYSEQWALAKINAPSAWDITTGSSSIIVAVVDTGIDTGHPDRPQNLLLGADFIADISGNTPVSGDPQGHGTHVAGIVAARTNNGTGVAGIAPGATLMAVRVLNEKGAGNTYLNSKGITYAADRGAKVINLSLSGTARGPFQEQAVNYAYNKGALVVAAAGNCYAGGSDCDNLTNPVMYPAALDHVVAVAATDKTDGHAWYSETGSYVDLAAPGNSILSICADADIYPLIYCWKTGTSMAAPHVAGVAALVWSVNPNLTPDQVEMILRQSAVDLGTPGRDDTFGYGRIDAYQAVARAQATLGYAAQYVGQSFPVTMTVGECFTASVQLKNTGGVTWQRGGASPVRLATSQPQDRSSPFYTPGNWLSPSRPAALDQVTVAPGQTGSFTFVLTAPSAGGTFTEYFQAVVEGQAWLDQPVIWSKVHALLPPQPYKTHLPFVGRQASGW